MNPLQPFLRNHKSWQHWLIGNRNSKRKNGSIFRNIPNYHSTLKYNRGKPCFPNVGYSKVVMTEKPRIQQALPSFANDILLPCILNKMFLMPKWQFLQEEGRKIKVCQTEKVARILTLIVSSSFRSKFLLTNRIVTLFYTLLTFVFCWRSEFPSEKEVFFVTLVVWWRWPKFDNSKWNKKKILKVILIWKRSFERVLDSNIFFSSVRYEDGALAKYCFNL